jgi:hypothetical protein
LSIIGIAQQKRMHILEGGRLVDRIPSGCARAAWDLNGSPDSIREPPTGVGSKPPAAGVDGAARDQDGTASVSGPTGVLRGEGLGRLQAIRRRRNEPSASGSVPWAPLRAMWCSGTPARWTGGELSRSSWIRVTDQDACRMVGMQESECSRREA